MTLHRPLLMQPAGGDPDNTYSGAEMRAMFAALYPFEGIIGTGQNPGGFLVAQRGAGANLSVDVAAGMAAITGNDVAGQNTYLCWSDATSNLVMPAAPGSGTRFHRVGLRIKDKLASGSWTTYEFLPDVVQDTGTGFPAEPASFLTLAQASIAAGQSSYTTAQLTDLRPVTGPLRKWKVTNDHRTSTSLTADADLQGWRVAAGAGYKITGCFGSGGSAAGGISIQINVPTSPNAGSRWHWTAYHYGDANQYSLTADNDYSQSAAMGVLVSLNYRAMQVDGLLFPSVAGTVSVNWGSITGSDVQLNQGSWMEVQQIA